MRFVYFPILFKKNEKVIIDGDHAHHLINVVRISRDEKITLLDGKGNFAIGKIDNISKRSIELQVEHVDATLRPLYLSMAIPVCRRENLESMIKSAVEIGVESIIFILCDFSSSKLIDLDRVERLIISAMEQSGNNFHPKILPTMSITEFVSSELFDSYFVPSSQIDEEKELKSIEPEVSHKNVLVIGPEGGFSQREHELLVKIPKVHLWRSPTPILRSVTALPFFAGQLIQKIASAAKM